MVYSIGNDQTVINKDTFVILINQSTNWDTDEIILHQPQTLNQSDFKYR